MSFWSHVVLNFKIRTMKATYSNGLTVEYEFNCTTAMKAEIYKQLREAHNTRPKEYSVQVLGQVHSISADGVIKTEDYECEEQVT